MPSSRVSGVLLHPTSLPSRLGIGTFGAEAYEFADFLIAAGQTIWEILPLGPTSIGNSPYQCLSAFAINPLLISLEMLGEEKWLEQGELDQSPSFSRDRVDYEKVIEFKMPLLRKSYERFTSDSNPSALAEFEAFCSRSGSWLEAYSLFMAIKKSHNNTAWNEWEEGIRRAGKMSDESYLEKLADEASFHKYLQFQAFRQWSRLKTYCNDHGIKIMGDVAHFVALDSADVWQHQDMFYLDSESKPTVVAGVPPDYFCKTGQFWGNPVYRWPEMAKDGYSWWIERFRSTFSLMDSVRMDHFRGFEQYWEIAGHETTAVNGRWALGPGANLFEAVKQAIGQIQVLAEDLGMITAEVSALRESFGFPGMRVLQFAFGSEGTLNPHRPHNYLRNCVVFTGTHDNDTTIGWFRNLSEEGSAAEKERNIVLKYLGSTGEEINWDLIRLALSSIADIAIIPFQDILGLGSEARMNTPGTMRGNWEWRFRKEMVNGKMIERLKELTEITDRHANGNDGR